ncbi:glucose 1-dehydrogenase [Xanthobacter sp. VNH20]|uniref:SDR family NAD(P)-dependent oxidoreductase n=1 Tax=Xanthobacter sp. VNH20 TaxID=3156616 RepID=UPI0032B54958
MRILGKVAFITGAGTGIGAVAAKMFAREGAKVVVAEINEANGNAVVADIHAAGGEAYFVRCDVTDEDSVRESVVAAVAKFGTLDVLYNNVGGSTPHDGPVTEVAMEEFWRAIKLDLLGTFLPCRHAIPVIIKNGGGSVINTTSYVAMVGTAGRDCYTAAKGAIISLTRSMAVEFGPHKVRVNGIAPGAVDTERLRNFLKDAPDHPTFDPRNRHRRPEVASHLMGIVQPEDIAAAALFLASDDAQRMTGTITVVDSGASAW